MVDLDGVAAVRHIACDPAAAAAAAAAAVTAAVCAAANDSDESGAHVHELMAPQCRRRKVTRVGCTLLSVAAITHFVAGGGGAADGGTGALCPVQTWLCTPLQRCNIHVIEGAKRGRAASKQHEGILRHGCHACMHTRCWHVPTARQVHKHALAALQDCSRGQPSVLVAPNPVGMNRGGGGGGVCVCVCFREGECDWSVRGGLLLQTLSPIRPALQTIPSKDDDVAATNGTAV